MAGQCFSRKEDIKMASYGVHIIDPLYTMTMVGVGWSKYNYAKKLERDVCQCEAAAWGLEVLTSA